MLAALWRSITAIRQIFANLIFLALIVVILVFALGGEDHSVPDRAALIIDPSGVIVEQRTAIDPVEQLFTSDEEPPRETLLKDLLDAIEYAREDDRIPLLVLKLDQLRMGTVTGLSKLQELGAALAAFRESGKQIYAFGAGYDQNQYYLAAHADRIYLHDIGFGGFGVLFEGLGLYTTFFHSALEKLKADVHVFRVGTFKAAVEPYIRDDMSDDAKEAHRALLDSMWSRYKEDLVSLRPLSAEELDRYIDQYDELAGEAGNDVARLAVEQKLVDDVLSSEAWIEEVAAIVGRRGTRFEGIDFRGYVAAMRPPIEVPNPAHDKVAVVIAKGEILDGSQPQGTIGGVSTSRLVRQAREDDSVKALVLRVDSPGGSAFASEMIRSELNLLQESGKPLVVSMGSLAASGGYWISAGADRIVATPMTITGSIGIFGILPTLDRSADALGIHVDGVGTEELSGAGNPLMPLNPMLERTLQQMVDRGYQRFIELVAEGRDMTPEEVDRIGQGRVWSGLQALDLGLVDRFGHLDDAVKEAADLAGIDEYDTLYLEKPPSARERIMSELFGSFEGMIGRYFTTPGHSRWLATVVRELRSLERMNDPYGVYLQCFACLSW